MKSGDMRNEKENTENQSDMIKSLCHQNEFIIPQYIYIYIHIYIYIYIYIYREREREREKGRIDEEAPL